MFFQTPSPAKRSLFLSEIKSPSKKTCKKSSKISLCNNGECIVSDEEDFKDDGSAALPFKTYANRRDSGCHEAGESCHSPLPSVSTTLAFHSCSSGDENFSDNCFTSPIRSTCFRSPRKNFKSRIAVSASPGSSSGISTTSPARSPPETPPHTQKLRALTLFDTPHTPKTLMSRLRSNNVADKLPSISVSPVPEKSQSNVQYSSKPITIDISNQENEEDDFSDVIHRSNVHLPVQRPPALRTSPLVNINPFTPDNRSTIKRSRPKTNG